MSVLGLHTSCNVNNGVKHGATPCLVTSCCSSDLISNVTKSIGAPPGGSVH